MRLREWIDSQPYGEIARLVRTTGISNTNMHELIRESHLATYATAKKLIAATGGDESPLTLDSLCEPRPKPLRKRRSVKRKRPRASAAAA